MTDHSNILVEALEFYGQRSQILKCIEEMSELTQVLIKYLNQVNVEQSAIQGEIADVQITLDQMKLLFFRKNSGTHFTENSYEYADLETNRKALNLAARIQRERGK